MYKFTTAHIEADLCTHIIHAFSQITDGVLAWYEHNDASKYTFYLIKLFNSVDVGRL